MDHRRTETEKADTLGERVVLGSIAIASGIMEELNKHNIAFRDKDAAPQFLIEIIAFYMYLVDRLAFTHLGVDRREIFADRLIVAIVKVILEELSKEVSADDFCNTLRNAYNRRQMEYSRCKRLVPEKDESPKDTLYWEFSKILLEYMDEQTPTAMFLLLTLTANFSAMFLTKSPKVEDVLLS